MNTHTHTSTDPQVFMPCCLVPHGASPPIVRRRLTDRGCAYNLSVKQWQIVDRGWLCRCAVCFKLSGCLLTTVLLRLPLPPLPLLRYVKLKEFKSVPTAHNLTLCNVWLTTYAHNPQPGAPDYSPSLILTSPHAQERGHITSCAAAGIEFEEPVQLTFGKIRGIERCLYIAPSTLR